MRIPDTPPPHIRNMLKRLQLLLRVMDDTAYQQRETEREAHNVLPKTVAVLEAIRTLNNLVAYTLKDLGVSTYEGRLQGDVPAKFLATLVRLDEIAVLEALLVAREAERANWQQDQDDTPAEGTPAQGRA